MTCLRRQYLDRLQGLIRVHCVETADGQDGPIQAFLAYIRHLIEQGSIPGDIELFAFHCKDEAARLTAIRAVRQAGAMDGVGQLNRAEWECAVLPEVETLRIQPLFFQPDGRSPCY